MCASRIKDTTVSQQLSTAMVPHMWQSQIQLSTLKIWVTYKYGSVLSQDTGRIAVSSWGENLQISRQTMDQWKFLNLNLVSLYEMNISRNSSTSITQKQKAFKIQDFLTFDTIDEQVFMIQIVSGNSEIFQNFIKNRRYDVDRHLCDDEILSRNLIKIMTWI